MANSKKNVKFARQSDFRSALRERVGDYFLSHQTEERDQPAMYVKTLTIFLWFFTSYILLVFAPIPFWGRILAAVSLAFAAAGIGFSVMHDAGHGAYSKRPWVNKTAFFALDFLGGSSYLWNIKHNVLHHSFANIDGHDDDIDIGVLGRLSPEQRYLPFHRFQHFYVWFLYGMMTVKWHLYDDFNKLIQGQIGPRKIPAMKTGDKIIFVAGKLLFVSYAFVIPALVWGIWWTLAFYFLATFVQGVIMGTTFQLAHCVEEAQFPVPCEAARLEHDWATHQVMTTVNFAPKNRLMSWYVGGLNFQIEHHLFPKISHIHYPALSQIVEQTCQDFGLPYRVNRSTRSGIASHFRWLRSLGRGQVVEA